MVDIKKNIKYQKEQKAIYYRLIELLNFNGDYTFTKYTLENDKKLQENILSLKDDIKKYYSSSSCKGVNNKACKREYFSIIRYIMKLNNKEIYKNDINIKIDNKNKRTTKYKIIDADCIMTV